MKYFAESVGISLFSGTGTFNRASRITFDTDVFILLLSPPQINGIYL